MRIAINALCQVGAGSRTYLWNILPRLPAASRNDEFLLFLPADGNVIPTDEPWMADYERITVPIHTASTAARMFREQVHLPVLLRKHDVDVLFSPVETTTIASPCPTVVALRDPNPYQWPNPVENRSLERSVKKRILRELCRVSAMRSSAVVFVSDYSRQAIASQLRIPDKKAITIHHGISDTFFAEDTGSEEAAVPGFDEPYILCVSTINPHKNYEALIEAYAALPPRIQASYRLHIAGLPIHPRYMRDLEELVRERGLSSRVSFLGEVPHAEIHHLYRGASLFAFPSKLETFGHPLVEAMASGLPVVASSASCIPEIVGDAGKLVHPKNIEGFSLAMEQILEDPKMAEEMGARSRKRASAFSWEESVRKLLDVLHRAGGGRGANSTGEGWRS